MTPTDRGASGDQIGRLPCWRYKQVDSTSETPNFRPINDNPDTESSRNLKQRNEFTCQGNSCEELPPMSSLGYRSPRASTEQGNDADHRDKMRGRPNVKAIVLKAL
ncbi:hypothetical protein Nepgr_020059 [Nepenthes gracilis]|uniref:Uncharacterized protein n=1 Tax=Nepenthes gracilis TaxID=150966 RepID=A0AAD3SVA1_NEPGR|nr:hypothetical protein Nepgr_020059 [Nepenthes gracilis]